MDEVVIPYRDKERAIEDLRYAGFLQLNEGVYADGETCNSHRLRLVEDRPGTPHPWTVREGRRGSFSYFIAKLRERDYVAPDEVEVSEEAGDLGPLVDHPI